MPWIQDYQSVNQLSLLLSTVIKESVRFFPHEISDLSIALDFLLLPDGLVQDSSQWALRYVILIWLALICMIPFDLAQFDDTDRIGYTAAAIETVAKIYLGKAGMERDGASLLLSRLFMRYEPFLVYVGDTKFGVGKTQVRDFIPSWSGL
jgi:hypothetical protein